MINKGGTRFNHNTRALWHRTFCIIANACGLLLHIGHNWRYWSQTKFPQHWDTGLAIASSKISEMVNNFTIAN